MHSALHRLGPPRQRNQGKAVGPLPKEGVVPWRAHRIAMVHKDSSDGSTPTNLAPPGKVHGQDRPGRPGRVTLLIAQQPASHATPLRTATPGRAIVALKTPYDDGTSHVVLSPMEFMGRLAALVPKPRVNLTRFHGVFSPRSKLREHVVPGKPEDGSEQVSQSTRDKAYSMTWAQRLKRVFAIEIEKCEKCKPVQSFEPTILTSANVGGGQLKQTLILEGPSTWLMKQKCG